MNIVVVRPDGSFYTRPDTTLVRGARDYYLPDDLTSVTACRCGWISLKKSAKAVSARFAPRYYEAMGEGVLLYGEGTISYLDASTCIFPETRPAEALSEEEHGRIAGALEKVTRHQLLRLADLLVFEEPGSVSLTRGTTVDLYAGFPARCFKIC